MSKKPSRRIYNVGHYPIDTNLKFSGNLYLYIGGTAFIKCDVLLTKKDGPAKCVLVSFRHPAGKYNTTTTLYLTDDGTYKGAWKDDGKLAKTAVLWEMI